MKIWHNENDKMKFPQTGKCNTIDIDPFAVRIAELVSGFSDL